jgi:hypothetical protein
MSAPTEKGKIMSLITFPRKFVHGQKVGNVDVYGQLYLWPDGYFQYMVHIRNRDPLNGNGINVTFALLDEKQVLLGTYGMPAYQAWSVAAGQCYNDLHGKIPKNKLKKTGAVALLFRPQNQELDVASLQGLATVGSELVFCATPD